MASEKLHILSKYLTAAAMLFFAVSASFSVSCQVNNSITAGEKSNASINGEQSQDNPPVAIELPEISTDNAYALDEALRTRRSVRDFSSRDIEMEKISMILWAAQGITSNDTGYRTAPSAGALYPLDVFIFKSDGIYKYIPRGHKLLIVSDEDMRKKLYEACLLQESVKEAPVSIVITAEYGRTEVKYGSRAVRYADMEAGHVCQNILLEVTSLQLGAVPIGAFNDEMIIKLIGLTDAHTPLYVIPVGYGK